MEYMCLIYINHRSLVKWIFYSVRFHCYPETTIPVITNTDIYYAL